MKTNKKIFVYQNYQNIIKDIIYYNKNPTKTNDTLQNNMLTIDQYEKEKPYGSAKPSSICSSQKIKQERYNNSYRYDRI